MRHCRMGGKYVLLIGEGDSHLCAMGLYKSYVDYFRNLITSLPDFPAATDGVFEMIGIDEAFGDFRTAANTKKGIIFRLIDYTSDVGNYEAGSGHSIQGAFMVLKHHSNRKEGAAGQETAMDDTYKAVTSIINKMTADSNGGHPLFNYSLNKEQSFRISPRRNSGDVGWSGWLTSFTFTNKPDDCP